MKNIPVLIRDAAHSMCALSFVPAELFDELHPEFPEEFSPVATYFEVSYI